MQEGQKVDMSKNSFNHDIFHVGWYLFTRLSLTYFIQVNQITNDDYFF